MNIPDQPGALAGWLEEQLVGLELAELVADWQAVHAPSGHAATLDDVLGARRRDVLERGLAVVPPTDLRRLLRQPHLLLELQELVLEQGGTYWQQVDAGGQLEVMVRRGEQRI